MSAVPPIRQVILKVHSRCNLSCDYCYMYEHIDQRWRDRPRSMSARTIGWVAERLGEYAVEHHPPIIGIVLHGGEPLLAGVETIEQILTSIGAEMPPWTTVEFSIQTNGVLLDEAFLELFRTYGVRVGISLDGDRTGNDRHRRLADGRGSFDAVVRGIDLLREPRFVGLYAGLLATIDLANDPVGIYESLLRHEPPQIDLLLPHGNWSSPPPGVSPGARGENTYARWLIAVFERWYSAPRRETSIRLFDAILSLLLGGHSLTRAVGAASTSLLTIETDGGIEGDDALKTTTMDVLTTGLSIETHTLAEAASHPSIAGPGLAIAPAAVCRSCPVFGVCGGGLPAHRYRAGSGFDNPSVYCADLLELIEYVRSRVQADLDGRR